jgi:beta-N-acetylhexosaminidase
VLVNCFSFHSRGTDTSEISQIYDLVRNHHVGGVVLEQANDNFVGPDNSISAAQNLINSLQLIALSPTNETTGSGGQSSHYVPLFIGISQEGDGTPNDQILSGLTPLADEMAIGATWNTSRAKEIGLVLGRELTSIGVNLLLGPSLDVLDSTRTVDSEDLNVRLFGGDLTGWAKWANRTSRAFMREQCSCGSDREEFSGRGSADRPAENEVATVRKSLEQLKQIELAPFVR